ncbi:MAG: helix-turn-helix transcriptional regulator [Aequorivita sp.]|nr:helix-turn-helix transcriptional regulator [Aequorivita sp.]
MSSQKTKRLKILDQPSYWVEGINNCLYNAIMEFMEVKGMNRTQLAEHLGISKGRVSQILNDGEINFSIEKIVQLSLLLNKYPQFELIEKEDYIKEQEGPGSKTITIDYLNTEF